ncbi:ATP-binding protein [Paenibacillus beijingensis]|uniref:histidine kinase n=1 Tax=Paenibacillus beijingensis TaxID=1126833 RepID=A0A0D5NMV9_9BACL|nr:ATP-binding protein [Paenibacillus beijingensis]AJY76505.1 hypothetical protein VN24_20470 [Paenibacillus beijingensis]
MLIEILFLNVLIVIAPVLLYTAFAERCRHAHSPYVIGLMNGTASSLCLLFSYHELELYWDLRYIPLVLSTVYGGPLAGAINLVMILLTRTYIGGNALWFGYISMSLVFIGPLLAARKVRVLSGNSRIKAVMLVSIYPSFIMLLILVSYPFFNEVQKPADFPLLQTLLVFFVLHMLGAWLSSMLIEFTCERLKMRADIQRAEKMKTLGELAASIAHEVRNPLTVVSGFLQLMRPNEEGKNRQYLNFAMEELARAESIISDYLNFSKPHLTKLELVDLAEILNTIITLLTPMASKNNLFIDSALEERIYVFTDRGQLQQALVNVVKNAIEATPSGGKVNVSSAVVDGQARIIIADSGKGMNKEQLSRIGTLFFSTKEVGTGLGTAVAIRIIETMNGTIDYESEEGAGTTVTITLPLRAEQSYLSL